MLDGFDGVNADRDVTAIDEAFLPTLTHMQSCCDERGELKCHGSISTQLFSDLAQLQCQGFELRMPFVDAALPSLRSDTRVTVAISICRSKF